MHSNDFFLLNINLKIRPFCSWHLSSQLVKFTHSNFIYQHTVATWSQSIIVSIATGLHAGQSKVQTPEEVRDFCCLQNIQTSSGT
jgi:hypothetical protein